MGNNKVLVTGGAGYIGAHTVVELYNAGLEPILIDNFSKSDDTLLEGIKKIAGKELTFVKGDCADVSFVRRVFEKHGPFHSVIHFAAYKSVGESVQFPLMYHSNNVGSLLALLTVMQETSHDRLIFSSSCTVYGQPDQIPVNERTPFKRAESPYGASKQVCEQILQDCAKDFKIISLRYFNPIGAHESAHIGELPIGTPNNLVPYITQTAAGVRPKLTIFGGDYNTPDGTCIRDFIHVTDLAIAHVQTSKYFERMKSNGFEAFNLGTGQGVSVLELVKAFIEVTGVKLNYEVGSRRPGDVEKVYADPTRANQELNWQTKFSIGESLLHAWNWEKKIRGLA